MVIAAVRSISSYRSLFCSYRSFRFSFATRRFSCISVSFFMEPEIKKRMFLTSLAARFKRGVLSFTEIPWPCTGLFPKSSIDKLSWSEVTPTNQLFKLSLAKTVLWIKPVYWSLVSVIPLRSPNQTGDRSVSAVSDKRISFGWFVLLRTWYSTANTGRLSGTKSVRTISKSSAPSYLNWVANGYVIKESHLSKTMDFAPSCMDKVKPSSNLIGCCHIPLISPGTWKPAGGKSPYWLPMEYKLFPAVTYK